MLRRKIFEPESERLPQVRLGPVGLVLLGISLAAMLQQYRDVLMGRAESLDHSGLTSLIIAIILS
jgi:hypothetical protein